MIADFLAYGEHVYPLECEAEIRSVTVHCELNTPQLSPALLAQPRLQELPHPAHQLTLHAGEEMIGAGDLDLS